MPIVHNPNKPHRPLNRNEYREIKVSLAEIRAESRALGNFVKPQEATNIMHAVLNAEKKTLVNLAEAIGLSDADYKFAMKQIEVITRYPSDHINKKYGDEDRIRRYHAGCLMQVFQNKLDVPEKQRISPEIVVKSHEDPSLMSELSKLLPYTIERIKETFLPRSTGIISRELEDSIALFEQLVMGNFNKENRALAVTLLGSWFSASRFGEVEAEIPYLLKQTYRNPKMPLGLFLFMSKGGIEASDNVDAMGRHLPDLSEFIYYERMRIAGYERVVVYDEFSNVGKMLQPNGNSVYVDGLRSMLDSSLHIEVLPNNGGFLKKDVEKFYRYMRILHTVVMPFSMSERKSTIMPWEQNFANEKENAEARVSAYISNLTLEERRWLSIDKIDAEKFAKLSEQLIWNYGAIRRYAPPKKAWDAAAIQVAFANSKVSPREETFYLSHTAKPGRLKIGWPLSAGYSNTHAEPVIYTNTHGELIIETIPKIQLVELSRMFPHRISTYRVVDESGSFLANGLSIGDSAMGEDTVYKALQSALRKPSRMQNHNGNLTMGILNTALHLRGADAEIIGTAGAMYGIDNGRSGTVTNDVTRELSRRGVDKATIEKTLEKTAEGYRS